MNHPNPQWRLGTRSGLVATARGRPTNGCTDQDRREDMLLLVDFKWLMAGMGWWVNMTQWHTDAQYAERCLASASSSANACLKQRALEIRARRLGTSAAPRHATRSTCAL
jgi:hypothetical protein